MSRSTKLIERPKMPYHDLRLTNKKVKDNLNEQATFFKYGLFTYGGVLWIQLDLKVPLRYPTASD